VDGEVAGCIRLLTEADGSVQLGRVVLAAGARGRGLADAMMEAALAEAAGRVVALGGQSPLAGWYASHGFEQCGPEYLEDGIAHVPMRRVP
jgi:ElaA protein